MVAVRGGVAHLLPGGFEEGVEVRGRRRGVAPQQRALRELRRKLLRHAGVGQQHELLYHRVRVHYLLRLHLHGVVGL